MKRYNDADLVLARMIELLRLGGGDGWATALKNIKMDLRIDPEHALSQLLSLYGGMGSLNDVVLYRDGQSLVAENMEFDTLRSQLYELCQKIK
ncbi:DUF6966 domain-containing protein [Thauera sinica]|uniref:DUF6966 domain-containing protein n=1 Tax=Thauera sinica TaxID=2665146 RepID=A0ABW1AS69_9RHOO|nr:hypothetical protein [Thauera sp. K11]